MRDAASSGTDRLSVLAFLWGAATLSHHLAFPWWFDRHAWLNVALVTAAALVVVRPRSIILFAAVAGLGFVNVAKLAPEHPNHMLFEGFGDVVILSAVLLRWRHRTHPPNPLLFPHTEREQLFDTLARPIRVGLLVLYGFAVLHKLNWDFFDADVSCATVLMNDILDRHSLPPLTAGARIASVWGSLLIESAIPLGLAFSRSRSWAIAFALFFHLLLAQHDVTGLYSFSSTMLAVLFLFTPPDFTEYIGERVARARLAARLHPARTGCVVISSMLVALLAIGGEESRRLLWNLWALFAVGVYAGWAWGYGRAFRIESIFQIRPAVLWVFPLLLVVNGSSPYLGLRTHTSFSMYSNLRTENGRTNHLFLGRLFLGSWQEDLVEIIDSDLPAFEEAKRADLLLPYFRFRQLTGAAAQDFTVSYRRNGEVRVLTVRKGIASDPKDATAPPWWQRKVLHFRGVDREGPTRCWN